MLLKNQDEITIGVDIGGTETVVVGLAPDRTVVDRSCFSTPRGGERMVGEIASAVHRIGEHHLIRGIGIGTAGIVTTDGVISAASSSFHDWVGFDVRSYFIKEFGVTTVVENDVNAFLLGEMRFGSLRGVDDALGVMLGTGVGGAVAVGGQIFHGGMGGAAEIGHIAAGIDCLCSCGQSGHVEAVASGTSIAKRYSQMVGEDCSALEVSERARLGDDVANRVIADAGVAIAGAIHTAATLFDISDVVIGGGVCGSWDLLEPHVHDCLVTSPLISGRKLNITLNSLDRDATVLGAASLIPELAPV